MIYAIKHNVQNTFTRICQLLFTVALATTVTVKVLTAEDVRQYDVTSVNIPAVVLPTLPDIDLTRDASLTGKLDKRKLHYFKNKP